MTEQAKEARRAYDREYRKTHKAQIAENRRRYWERRGARLAAERKAAEHEQAETH